MELRSISTSNSSPSSSKDAQNLISDATAEIVDLITNGGLEGLLSGLLSSIELGGIIATLLKTIATILSTVLTALVGQTVDVASLEAVISTVTGLTGQLITTVVGNVTGLAGILAPIVSTVVGVLTGLGLDCTPITDADRWKGFVRGPVLSCIPCFVKFPVVVPTSFLVLILLLS
ncbi:hypothetical protein FA13DRAFT_623382 [Coprinellus micaceus]|uniref:Uncharacterized protein n=1 Tax=Coprinellus micaceus TaxID=71717 RepID=A0A4Y7T6B1_COPMI|nr:hypothetical protein FA13DRAFT_623382 [Coprinellus micaceus]